MVRFGRVLHLKFPTRRSAHGSHSRSMRPAPGNSVGEMLAATWFKMQASLLVGHNLLHGSQAGTDHRCSGGKGFRNSHGKILVANARQDEEACSLDGLLGFLTVQAAHKADR